MMHSDGGAAEELNAPGAMTPRPGISADAIRARFAFETVEAIKAKLGPNGRIGRLRGLFEPGGQIEIVSPGGLTGCRPFRRRPFKAWAAALAA